MLTCVFKKLNKSDDDDGNNKDFKDFNKDFHLPLVRELSQGIDEIQGKVSRKDACTCWH